MAQVGRQGIVSGYPTQPADRFLGLSEKSRTVKVIQKSISLEMNRPGGRYEHVRVFEACAYALKCRSIRR